MDRFALRIGVALQHPVRAERLLACPLSQTLRSGLVQLARRATARFVAQAGHALLAPVPPSLAHGADFQILHLRHLAAQQRLAEQQQGLGALSCAPVG